MKNKAVLAVSLFSSAIISTSVSAKVTYLSCPYLDNQASDLKIVLDQDNGTASLQSASSGPGLNFTAPASFGPEQVTWRKDNKSYKQTFSVDRMKLSFERKTFSEATGNTYSDRSECTIIKASKKAKF
ncbi:hypothetical protein ACBV55_13655 [Franconibacter pulveris]|uniref:hypothetical protein n=1 Tax=Cronobacter sakazakii TaxID=28141 RepID=UPI00100A4667|nr:hypothetical protein [Cronobacter sakazakii]